MELRKCKKCLTEKPANREFFKVNKALKLGITHTCRDCDLLYLRAYRIENRDRLNALQRVYSKKPERKEKHRIDMMKWRHENPEKVKKIQTKSYGRNGQKYNEAQKIKYATDDVFRKKRLDSDKRYTATGRRKELYMVNREKELARNKKYRECNRSKIRVYNAHYREENKDYLTALHASNVKNLSNSYVAHSMRKSVKDVSPEIIETKRLIIQLKRELKPKI